MDNAQKAGDGHTPQVEFVDLGHKTAKQMEFFGILVSPFMALVGLLWGKYGQYYGCSQSAHRLALLVDSHSRWILH